MDHFVVHHILIYWFLIIAFWNQISQRRFGGWKSVIIKMEVMRPNQALTPIDLANQIAYIIWGLGLVAMEVIVDSIILFTLVRYKIFFIMEENWNLLIEDDSYYHLNSYALPGGYDLLFTDDCVNYFFWYLFIYRVLCIMGNFQKELGNPTVRYYCWDWVS